MTTHEQARKEPPMSNNAEALMCRLIDVNFEFIKGVGQWPNGKEISPPNLELIRECGRQAEKHAHGLILEFEEMVQQRDGLLDEVQALKEQVQKLRSAIEYWAYRMDETHPRGYPRFNHETQEWEPTASWRETPDVTDLMTAQKMLLAALAGEEGTDHE